MEKIPLEVLKDICNIFDDRVTLKALRLVNKKFADIARRNFHRMEAEKPKSSSPMPSQTRKSRRCSRRTWLAVVLRNQRRWETWHWWDLGHKNIERLAQRFPSHQAPFSLPLPALGEIKTGWPFDVSTTGPRPGRPERAANFRHGFRDVLGAANKRCNAHLSFALLYLHNSGLRITTLELHQYREIVKNQMYPVPVLGYLKHSKLRFRHQFTVEWHTATPMAQDGLPNCYNFVLAPYLANAENLETLILSQQISNGTDLGDCILSALIKMLSTTGSWPKLRSIWVGALFTEDVYLVHFLMKHGRTLRSIHLNRPVEDERYWRLLASSIRVQYANTECVISSSDDKIFRSKSDCVIDSDMSEIRYDWVEPEENLAGLDASW